MIEITSQSAHGFTLADFRDHMRVDGSDHDDALERALDGAVVQVEKQTGIYLRSTTVRQHFRGIPTGLRLEAAPVAGAPTIYKTSDDSAVAASAYERDKTGATERIRVLERGSFDASTDYYATYSAGFTSGTNAVPDSVKVAVFELAGLHFENREAATPVQLYALPFSVRNILAPFHTGAL